MLPTSTERVRTTLLAAALAVGAAGCSSTSSTRPETPQTEAAAAVLDDAGAAVERPDVPERAQVSYQLALDAMRRGDVTEAELELEQLTLEFPDFAGPQVNLGIIYMESGRLDAAEAALQRALVLNPSHVGAYNQLGILLRRQGSFADAEKAYLDALAVDPDYALAHYNLGVLLDLYMKRPEEALPHYQRYQELRGDPDKRVAKWIVDLRRRLGITDTTTRVAQEDAP